MHIDGKTIRKPKVSTLSFQYITYTTIFTNITSYKKIEMPLLYIEFSLDFEKYIIQELYVVLMLWILEGPRYTIDWI